MPHLTRYSRKEIAVTVPPSLNKVYVYTVRGKFIPFFFSAGIEEEGVVSLVWVLL